MAATREPNQLRPLASEQALLHRANGSASFAHGATRCIASVHGPGHPRAMRRELPNRAVVEVVYKPAATIAGPADKEVEEYLHGVASAVLLLEQYPGCLIQITVQVMRDEGGVLACAINALTLALVDAGLHTSGAVAAATCALMGGGPKKTKRARGAGGGDAGEDGSRGGGVPLMLLLDPDAEEERAAAAVVTAVLQQGAGADAGRVVASHTAGRLGTPNFFRCLEACTRAAGSVAAFSRIAVEARLHQENATVLAAAGGGGGAN
eukprot:g306.t1